MPVQIGRGMWVQLPLWTAPTPVGSEASVPADLRGTRPQDPPERLVGAFPDAYRRAIELSTNAVEGAELERQLGAL